MKTPHHDDDTPVVPHYGQRWTAQQDTDLIAFLRQGLANTDAARLLGRTPGSVTNRKARLDLIVRPALCLYCGSAIEQKHTGRRRKYCYDCGPRMSQLRQHEISIAAKENTRTR